jgi:hypothetical protein
MCPTNMSSFGAKKRRQKLRALVVQWPQKLRLTEIQRKFVQVQSDSKNDAMCSACYVERQLPFMLLLVRLGQEKDLA